VRSQDLHPGHNNLLAGGLPGSHTSATLSDTCTERPCNVTVEPNGVLAGPTENYGELVVDGKIVGPLSGTGEAWYGPQGVVVQPVVGPDGSLNYDL
jgi:hypothetical protein